MSAKNEILFVFPSKQQTVKLLLLSATILMLLNLPNVISTLNFSLQSSQSVCVSGIPVYFEKTTGYLLKILR